MRYRFLKVTASVVATLILVLIFLGSAAAQTGSWNPAGADLSYPRTLLTPATLPDVRLSLARPESYGLYEGLYASVDVPLPTTDNTSAGGRRDRATYAKNAAFVLLLDRQPAAGALLPLSDARRATLLDRVKGLLESLNPAVESFLPLAASNNYNEWQWRSKELIDYLIAYDLLRGAGETDATLATGRSQLQLFAANLYTQSTTPYLGSIYFYSFVKNNHTLMTAAALGMAAVVLNDATGTQAAQQPLNWINAGLYNIDNVLWQDAQRQSDPTAVAGYAEGPYYFKYAFLNCLPFFRAMGNFLPDNTLSYTFRTTTRSIRNPYYDPRYDLLYDWITAIMMPDGRFPALEDSYVDMGMPELALTGKSRYVRPLHLEKLAAGQLRSLGTQLRDVTVDMRAAYLASQAVPTEPTNAPLTVLPRSGNLIFRSGNDAQATYLHVYGKSGAAQTNSGGHSQADATSFILHAQGQLLALDAGYLSYTRRGEVGNATNHNLVLVDGSGPAIGAPSAPNDAQATIQKSFQTSKLVYGEVQSTYLSTAVTRKTLFVRSTYYLLADFVQGAAAHTYTWQLHGYGLEDSTATSGSFRDSLQLRNEGTWRKNGVSLLAHVTATGGATAYDKATNIHEVTYNTTQNHTTLLVRKSGAAQTQFLAALYPFSTSRARLTTTSTATTAGLSAAGTGYKDLAFAQADTVLTTNGEVSADGLVNFYSVAADGSFSQAFLESGTVLQAGSAPVVRSAKRATISWQQTDAGNYEGYASRATTLTLPLAQAPQSVTGTGVKTFSYDATAEQLSIVLDQPSAFQVGTEVSGVLPVELVKFTARRQQHSVLLSWQTASEKKNKGFAIQRRADAETEFRTIGFLGGAGTSVGGHAYSYPDFAAPAGPAYYRLQQQDEDGTTDYSPVVAVTALLPTTLELTAVPNPVQSVLHVSFADTGLSVQLRLLNLAGQTVLRQQFRQQTELNVGSLMPGLYYLQALDNAGRPLAKTVKVVVAP